MFSITIYYPLDSHHILHSVQTELHREKERVVNLTNETKRFKSLQQVCNRRRIMSTCVRVLVCVFICVLVCMNRHYCLHVCKQIFTFWPFVLTLYVNVVFFSCSYFHFCILTEIS